MWKILCINVVFCIFHQVFGERRCPVPEDILPCRCREVPYTILRCQNINDAEDLKNVFVKSLRFSYQQVFLENSTLNHLPSDMFDKVEVHEMILKYVTLINLFDKPPKEAYNLRTLHIEGFTVERGTIWQILEPLTRLQILNIYLISIKALGDDFSKYAPVDLEEIGLYGTSTKTIKPGVFSKFKKLTKVDVIGSKLTDLTRDIFPTPFYVQSLHFDHNQIMMIPKGLFKDMPNLNTLSLRRNQIATVPENAFDSRGSFRALRSLRLEDNPLKCDCSMDWIVDYKPQDLRGACAYPKSMAGKQLKNLQRKDFHCLFILNRISSDKPKTV